MKKTIRIISLILAAALITLCAAGCGEEKTETGEKTGGNTVVFATNAEFAPFEYVVPGKGIVDHFDGIDIAIANRIARDMGKTLKVENMDFDSLIEVLMEGKCDAVIAAMSATDERIDDVDFSDSYYKTTQVMIVKEDSTISDAGDLKNKKIAVVQGYTGESALQEMGYKANEDFTAFNKGSEAILELVNSKCDVVVIDSAAAQKYISDNYGLKIVEDPEAFSGEEYSIAVKKGNKALLDSINETIKKMKEDGSINDILANYIDMEKVR